MPKLIRAMAGKASAEFRSRYPGPLRGTAGSFIILEQLRDGKMVKNIYPKIGGHLDWLRGSMVDLNRRLV